MTKELKKLYALLRFSRLHTLATHEALNIGVVLIHVSKMHRLVLNPFGLAVLN